MSESKLIIPAIGKVLAKVETTPGTKVALTDANDAVFFEEIEWQYASDNIQRVPLAPERHGGPRQPEVGVKRCFKRCFKPLSRN